MEVANVQYYPAQDFAQYLKIPGTSFSSLKDFKGGVTPGMQLGTRVHNFVNEPEQYDWVDSDLVIPIAGAIKSVLGDAYHLLQKELGITCDFIHYGLKLNYKGRIDMVIPGRIVVDLKVLAGKLQDAVKYFKYDQQISGYCLSSGCAIGLIVAYNKKEKKVETMLIKPDQVFWEKVISERGEIVFG